MNPVDLSMQEVLRKWKSYAEGVVDRHNELARKYNELLSQYKTLAESANNQQATFRHEKQALGAEVQSLRRLLQEVSVEKETVRQHAHEIEAANQELSEKVRRLEDRADGLRGQVRQLFQAQTHQVADLLRQVCDLEHRNRDLALGCNAFQHDRRFLGSTLEALRNELHRTNQEREAQQDTIRALEEAKATLISELDTSRKLTLPPGATNQRLTCENEAPQEKPRVARGETEPLQHKLHRLRLESSESRARELGVQYGERHTEKTCQDSLDSGRTAEEAVKCHERWDPVIPKPSWSSISPFTLGLDFGTHSTKLIVRARNDSTGRVLQLDKPSPGCPFFALPSLVRLTSGKLYFGRAALQTEGGKLLRSLKVSLLPPASSGEWGAEVPQGTTPDLLVALYLSWVLGRARKALPDGGLDRLSLNVAAPMGHVEDASLKERYLHVVHAAWQATFGQNGRTVDQGSELALVRPWFQELLESEPPDVKYRRFEVLPETLAPLVSLFQDPQAMPGLYLMADMGAGTTELSVSQVNQMDADSNISCYADRSVLLGGDQFNANDEAAPRRGPDHSRKEQGLITELLRHFRQVWHAGFSKDKDGPRSVKYLWRKLTVVLSGGGLRRSSLETAIRATCPQQPFFIDLTEYDVAWHRPANLELAGLDGNPGLRDDLSFLAVANGLSLERQRWPKFYFPRDMETRLPEPKVESPYERSYLEQDV